LLVAPVTEIAPLPDELTEAPAAARVSPPFAVKAPFATDADPVPFTVSKVPVVTVPFPLAATDPPVFIVAAPVVANAPPAPIVTGAFTLALAQPTLNAPTDSEPEETVSAPTSWPAELAITVTAAVIVTGPIGPVLIARLPAPLIVMVPMPGITAPEVLTVRLPFIVVGCELKVIVEAPVTLIFVTPVMTFAPRLIVPVPLSPMAPDNARLP
jgi:hypothetical protein